jgi:hypothetical protein
MRANSSAAMSHHSKVGGFEGGAEGMLVTGSLAVNLSG